MNKMKYYRDHCRILYAIYCDSKKKFIVAMNLVLSVFFFFCSLNVFLRRQAFDKGFIMNFIVGLKVLKKENIFFVKFFIVNVFAALICVLN